MKNHKFKTHCALCTEEKENYTVVLSPTDNYILCDSCYPRYDCLDSSGRRWLRKEYMDGMKNESILNAGG